jgi:hypothetical protein
VKSRAALLAVIPVLGLASSLCSNLSVTTIITMTGVVNE